MAISKDELEAIKVRVEQVITNPEPMPPFVDDAAALVVEVERLAEELEMERMRVAACSTASIQNTESSMAKRIERDNPYWSVAYGDVCRAVDREMAHRAEGKRLRVEVELLGAEIVRLREDVREQTNG